MYRLLDKFSIGFNFLALVLCAPRPRFAKGRLLISGKAPKSRASPSLCCGSGRACLITIRLSFTYSTAFNFSKGLRFLKVHVRLIFKFAGRLDFANIYVPLVAFGLLFRLGQLQTITIFR